MESWNNEQFENNVDFVMKFHFALCGRE